MTQQEIINYLIKRKNPVTLNELSDNLKINKTNVSRACRQLEKNKEIKVNKVKQGPFIRFMIVIKHTSERR
jgi:uncharacterized membrane protein